MLGVVEINSDNQIAAIVMFDLDDFDAAIAELDARYLAGEAAALRAHVVGDRGGLRRAQPARAPRDDAGLGEHRPSPGTAFAPGDLIAYIRAGWERRPGRPSTYIEAVHRLSDLGAVCHLCGAWDLARGLRRRVARVNLLTVEGDMVNRCELFDEADLDAALARFEQLSRPAPRLENAASQVPTRASLRTSRRATGTPCAAMLADDIPATIAGG